MEFEDFEKTLANAGIVRLYLAGGQCPFQVEAHLPPMFGFSDPCLYFRARGEEWTLEVFPSAGWCEAGEEAVYSVRCAWGDEPFKAGYMTLEQALPIILNQLKALPMPVQIMSAEEAEGAYERGN